MGMKSGRGGVTKLARSKSITENAARRRSQASPSSSDRLDQTRAAA